MGKRRTAAGAAVVSGLAVLGLLVAPSARAQDSATAEGGSTSTTAPGGASSTTSSTTSTSSTTTTTTLPGKPPGSSTTTTVPAPPPTIAPGVTIPPELVDDPRAPVLLDPGEGDGGEVPEQQVVFDPGTNEILQEKVDEITATIGARLAVLAALKAEIDAQQEQVDRLMVQLDELGERSRANVEAAAAASKELRDHTVEAFIQGSLEDRMALVRTGDPVELGVARELLSSVVESDEAVLRRHHRAQSELDGSEKDLSARLDTARKELIRLTDQFRAVLADVANEAEALEAYRNGARVYVEGFVFPVRGKVEFIDSWGYPRMMGTASAHWHQGTDVFAPMGTPLVAAESGVIERRGQASLGGNKLWVKGDSGTDYYYAHLVAFAEGMANGTRVNAGDVVGFVGDTGNARGTPPHLHFEIHSNGGPVNPYPVLKAAYGNTPMVKVVVAPPTTAPPVPATATPAPAAGPPPADGP